jgi:hypothetical protein
VIANRSGTHDERCFADSEEKSARELLTEKKPMWRFFFSRGSDRLSEYVEV